MTSAIVRRAHRADLGRDRRAARASTATARWFGGGRQGRRRRSACCGDV